MPRPPESRSHSANPAAVAAATLSAPAQEHCAEHCARAFRQASIGWLVQRLAVRFESAMTEALRAEGLTLPQFAVLMRVFEADGQTQTELGAAFAMPAWKISRALDSLEAAGLVERRSCAVSRRTRRIHATSTGLDRAPRLRALASAINDRVLAPLTPDDRVHLQTLLQAVT